MSGFVGVALRGFGKALKGDKTIKGVRPTLGRVKTDKYKEENQKSDWKDEFVLLTISSPLFLLAYSVFAEDEKMQEKIDLYFEKLQEMPWWIVGLWASVVAAIYGLKATDIMNMNKK